MTAVRSIAAAVLVVGAAAVRVAGAQPVDRGDVELTARLPVVNDSTLARVVMDGAGGVAAWHQGFGQSCWDGWIASAPEGEEARTLMLGTNSPLWKQAGNASPELLCAVDPSTYVINLWCGRHFPEKDDRKRGTTGNVVLYDPASGSLENITGLEGDSGVAARAIAWFARPRVLLVAVSDVWGEGTVKDGTERAQYLKLSGTPAGDVAEYPAAAELFRAWTTTWVVGQRTEGGVAWGIERDGESWELWESADGAGARVFPIDVHGERVLATGAGVGTWVLDLSTGERSRESRLRTLSVDAARGDWIVIDDETGEIWSRAARFLDGMDADLLAPGTPPVRVKWLARGGDAPDPDAASHDASPARVARFEPISAFDGRRFVTGITQSPALVQVGEGKGDFPGEFVLVHHASLWDVESGGVLRRFEGQRDPINAVAFSPDGKLVATGAGSSFETNVYRPFDGSIRVWDAETGAEVRRFAGHPDGYVMALQFSADGGRILSVGRDSRARIWDVDSGQLLFAVENVGELPPGAEFSPDGRTMLAIVRRTVRVLDATSGSEICRIGFDDPTKAFDGAAFSPDGRRIVTRSTRDVVLVWDARTGEPLLEIAGHERTRHDPYIGNVSGAQFGVDGAMVVTASADGTVRLWDSATGEERMRLSHPGPVRLVVLSPDGGRCLATWQVYDEHQNPGPLRASLWDLESGREITRIMERAEFLVGFAPDGGTFLIGALGPESLWDAETGHLLRRFDPE